MFAISYEKLKLSNGLEVILHEDHTLPLVAVNVWYHVGSKDEKMGRTGFAHLFEHVMFEGSKHHNKSYFEPLQKAGANLNGSTTSDRTNYWETLPSDHLELALWLESDRMGFLLDALDQKRFDIQRDVVKNERRQSYENRPYGRAHMLLQPALFPLPHPYHWMTIGTPEDLESATVDDAKQFFRRYYAPSNASLAIAGDFDGDEAMRLVERYFGDIPPGPAFDRVGRMDSDLRGTVFLTTRDKVQLPRLYLTWPTISLFDPDQAPLDMLGSVLGDGKASRLYRSLVYEKQIAQDLQVAHYAQEIAGGFHLQVTASPGHSLEEIRAVVEEELDRVRREPPSEQELARVKNRIESHHIHQLEMYGGFGGRADQLNFYNVFAADPGLVNTIIDRYTAVSAEDISRVAAQALQGNYVRLDILPEETLGPSNDAVDRSVMPGPATPPRYSPPVPQRDQLSNGLKLLFVEDPGLPTVAFGLVLRAGAAGDPPQRPGLAHMTANMLTEGTAGRSSQEIAEAMEFLGSYLDVGVGREHAALSAETLTTHWSAALEITADVVRNASFPQDEFERVRRERLTDLRRVADDPVSIASRASRAVLYGPDSVLGHPVQGTERSVDAMGREELMGHFKAHYGPENATLLVVGQVSRDDVLSHAEALFGDWSTDETPAAPVSDADDGKLAATTIFLADKPGAAQSVIRAGHLTVSRHHPDYHALNLMNYIFGGQFAARLNMNLRQDKGYSYGYLSSIDWMSGPSAFVAGGAVQTAVTKEAVHETLQEMSDIRDRRPVTEEEFNAAKQGIFRGFPAQFETQGRTLQHIAHLVRFGLPDTYFSTYLANLEAVSIDDVRRVAKERIDDAHLAVLVVGDREVVEPPLRELGLPIVPVDYEGRQLA